MANIIKCDACDALSPDKLGLYVANHWTKVTTQTVARSCGGREKEFHICSDCMRKGVVLSEKGISHD